MNYNLFKLAKLYNFKMFTQIEMLLILFCFIIIFESYYDMRRERQYNETVNYLLNKINRKVTFSKKNEIRYYHLSQEEREMKQIHSRYLSYQMYMMRQRMIQKIGF